MVITGKVVSVAVVPSGYAFKVKQNDDKEVEAFMNEEPKFLGLTVRAELSARNQVEKIEIVI